MRATPWIVLTVSACGTDVRTDPSDATGPDAGMPADAASTADAAPIPPDATPVDLEPCEEAVFHSDLAWIQEEIFDVSCTDECHGDEPPAARLSLRPGQAHAALVAAASTQFSGWLRVAPGDPGASMLMVQIGGAPGPALDGLMPWGMPKLCDEKIDAIRRWIAAGAQP